MAEQMLFTESSSKNIDILTGSNKLSDDFAIKNLPEEERPRERLLLKGPSALSTSELLAIVIGKGAPGISAVMLSQKIISAFGDLNSLCKVSATELLAFNGVGLAKACQILAVAEISRRLSGAPVLKSQIYSSSKSIYHLIKPHLINKDREHFLVIALDSRRRLIAVDNISIGTISQSIVHPREVFKVAINRRASFIVIAHNHPSGDTSPSSEDLAVTHRLVAVSQTIGIPILDHIIVSDSGYMSFKHEEYLT